MRNKITARGRQVGGDHYQKAIQPWDIIECYGLNFWLGNALKYLLREKLDTDRVEDLQKAIHYLEFEIERIERQESPLDELTSQAQEFWMGY